MAAGARLCAQHGQPSPFPGRHSGAESSSGPTNPRASALTSFLSSGYYGIFQCSAIWYCHFLQDSFILEHCLGSPMIAAVQRSLRKIIKGPALQPQAVRCSFKRGDSREFNQIINISIWSLSPFSDEGVSAYPCGSSAGVGPGDLQ